MEDSIEKEENNKEFICGVVEGFYGRPWTKIQREELFKKLKRWGLDAYVYAPKDDYKHRAYWRELYEVEEADHLSSLIAAAKENSVRFYYALSPGLDMTYSSQKEIQILKRKLDQVSQFGCEAFALLFDDIDSELCKADKEMFQTFANAQVSVTNEVFTHLGSPHFLFCPTQYCSSRAVPSVRESEYLNTLGSKLINDIDILWTGNKVISKTITLESIQEITEVLRRPPIIWDNIHANDYDQKRVFLGPYTGRSPALIPHLRGVLTNPNCEFHANTIAIHTLSSWSRCSINSKVDSSLSANIKLETESEDGIPAEDIPIECCDSEKIYHPKIALKKAVIEWLPEFFVKKDAWGPITKPQPQVTMVMPIPIIPSINTCMSLTTTTATSTTTKTVTVPEVNTTQFQALADVCNTVSSSTNNPISNPVMNSLVSPTKVVTNDDIQNPIPSIASNIELPKKIPISIMPMPIMEKAKDVEIENNIVSSVEIDALLTIEHDIRSNDLIHQEVSTKCKDVKTGLKENSTIDESVVVEEKIVEVYTSNTVFSIESEDHNLSPIEAMECSSLNSQISSNEVRKTEDDIVMFETSLDQENCMQTESVEFSPLSNEMKDVDTEIRNVTGVFIDNISIHGCSSQTQNSGDESYRMTVEDLLLLCDLFYLPFEHGKRGCKILNEFNWLKANAHILLNANIPGQKIQIDEWLSRAERFSELNDSVQSLMVKVSKCQNKEICYDLYTYVWDIASALVLLNAFIKWLSLRHFPHNMFTFIQGTYTWFSKGWREAFMSGDQEPWVFRGGLTADLQRLMPVDSGNDLFIYKLPEHPHSHYFILRPYQFSDELALYNVCRSQFLRHVVSEDFDNLPTQLSNLIPDSLVGPYITLEPEFCMVAQNSTDNEKIVGYCAAVLDVNLFWQNVNASWIPEMREKYTLSMSEDELNQLRSNSNTLSEILNNLINDFHEADYQCPVEVSATYPASLTIAICNDTLLSDESLLRRLLTVMLAALRSNGCFGVHVRLTNAHYSSEILPTYSKVGFVEIFRNNRYIYMGRRF